MLAAVGLALASFLAVALAAAARLARRRAAELSRPPPGAGAWRAVVVVPCKGLEPGLAEGLEAYATQRYPGYRLVLVTATADDPAVTAIAAVVGRHAHARHVVATLDERHAQKLFNVIRGVESAGDAEVYAFGDSDIGPDPDWLGRLVSPLADSRIGATTGYRWYTAERPTFWERLTILWNGFALTYLAVPALRFVWGGTYAMRRETLEAVDLRRVWRDVLSDDLTLTSALQKLGLRVAFVPSCVSWSPAAFTFGTMIEWTTRQMVMTRFYFPRVFYGSLALVVLGLALSVLAPGVFVGVAIAFGVATIALARATLPAGDARRPRWVEAALFPLVNALLAAAVLIALVRRTLSWRGVVYRVDSATRVTVLESAGALRRSQSRSSDRRTEGAGYDAIVIGSGIGGLAAASLLARVGGRRVLVLERQFRPGGLTRSFRRGPWAWDVGLYYVGEMEDGSMARRLLDLASGGRLRWSRMPSPIERFEYPGFRFEVPDDPAAYLAALGEAFPRERAGLRGYFGDVARASGWLQRHVGAQAVPPLAAPLLERPGRARALRTTRAAIEARILDPLLRAVLASQWGDLGLPPSRSAFALHAAVVNHYLHGAYYPIGGAEAIAASILPEIAAAGGECRLNHEVTEVLVERGRAVGVRARARSGRTARELELRAPVVISAAGADATFLRLLSLPHRPPGFDGSRADDGTSVVSLYVGLKQSPAALGFGPENRWLFDGTDHDALYARRGELLRGRATAVLLAFPSLKDPAAGAHTAQMVALADADAFAAWRGHAWRRRGAEYDALKRAISDTLLEFVERRYPGFRDGVAFTELSTPISVEHFTGHRCGVVYGGAGTPERFRDPAYRVRTHLPGLLLAGTDAGTLGVTGAFMGGALAAAAALGPAGFPRILAAAPRR
jgi:phytoene dehydrogenase-like protein